jgi:predicted aspartyl protease
MTGFFNGCSALPALHKLRAVVAGVLLMIGSTSSALAQIQTYVPMQASSGGSLELSVTIEGIAAVFLLDTGATLATINDELFARLRHGKRVGGVREVAARMADGRLRRLSVYTFHNLALGEHCELGSFEAIVVPGKGRNLLGLNVLAGFSPITLEVNPPSLGLSSCTDAVATVMPGVGDATVLP